MIMKTRSLLIALFGILLVSCNTRDPFFEFNAETSVRVELGLSILETHNYIQPNVIIPYNSAVNNFGINQEDIDEVLPYGARIYPKFGDEINLEFINQINVYLIDTENNRRREIFYLENIPFGNKTEITLLPSIQDITGLVTNDKAVLEVSLELRQFPPTSFDLELSMNFAGFATE